MFEISDVVFSQIATPWLNSKFPNSIKFALKFTGKLKAFHKILFDDVIHFYIVTFLHFRTLESNNRQLGKML